MTQPAYAVARSIAPTVAQHLRFHRAALPPQDPAQPPLELLPDSGAIEALVDTAFWASVRREEGYIPKISLAFLRPIPEVSPLLFARSLPLDPSALTRLAAAVERPGIHLGVWPEEGALKVWGMTHTIPPFCFVVEVVAPGLLVLKHRPRHESRKFVNLAVLEGDSVKVVDERASLIDDCPVLLTSMLGFEAVAVNGDALNVQVQLALSMRRHGRGGILLIVPSDDIAWRDSIVHPIRYAVEPAYQELSQLLEQRDAMVDHEWSEAIDRAIDALAGLTAVDGATAGHRSVRSAGIRSKDHTPSRLGDGGTRRGHGTCRREHHGAHAPRATGRHASSLGRSVRTRPAERRRTRRVAGRTLHNFCLVGVR